MKKIGSKIKQFFIKWKEVFLDTSYIKMLPKELIFCINRTKRLMIYFAGIMLLGIILTFRSIQFIIPYILICSLVELILLSRYLKLKNNLMNENYEIYTGKVVGAESPWWLGGKLNYRRDNQILIIETYGDRTMVKCSLTGNISANLTNGSLIKIYAKDIIDDDSGMIMITSYYAIVNDKKSYQPAAT